jgi:hypothetical protein
MSGKSFRARLGAEGRPLFVEVPFDVKAEFGKARPPVKASVNGHSYRSTISVYGGKYYLPVRSERREAAGMKAGDIVDVIISLDTAVRRVAIPSVLAAAFKKNGAARAQWEKLSYSCRKEHADYVSQAKKPETSARRVQNVLKMLAEKARS